VCVVWSLRQADALAQLLCAPTETDILAGHRLAEQDRSTFDAFQNQEQIDKALVSLKDMCMYPSHTRSHTHLLVNAVCVCVASL
jgi:hypothetical protein